MAELIEVSDPGDPRLADYRDLRDVQLRTHLEAEHGLFLAEGEKVVRRAVEAGFTPRSFLMASRWLEGLSDVLDRSAAPCFVVSEALAEQVTGFHVHRGALASLERRPLPSLDEVLEGARQVLVLEDLVDHTNVGAAFRNAAGLGVDAVLLTPSCADPLYRRAIKVSMGAVFQVPWTRFQTWPADMSKLRDWGFLIAGMTLAEDSVELDDIVAEAPERLALIFGTEGHGLGPTTIRSLDRKVRIPMRAGVDSLNVAAATAVAFYATRTRNWSVEG
ncbi:MAG TPA: RNA methyltransferase [Nocardioides sp.]|nr:RNA methyltransferase [Nocardioides sp.]